ncbi:PREDICTED: transmembrane protein 222 isoform X5 [Crocodylus porosus]|uniref:transmembrane protein 222 isoform X5 n=1 Tax=Crocodylus porosus TaxID=8502 RepID=UPI00093DF4ED|nr:PREDICTED: transmembrane protein 222 isoform X5 [Crocodylus porosus]
MRSAAASPTASYGRPSPCSHGSSQSLAIWASVHQLESFGTLQGPTMSQYWKLDPNKVYSTSPNAWDTAVHDASEEYKHRMHNLCCDNCHSHVALALNLMRYDNSSSWNMVKLCFFSLLYGKYVRGICEDVASLCPLLGGNPDSRFNPSLAVMGPVIFPSPWCPEEEPWLLSPARWRHRTLGIT